ncbi:hypothetical protein BJV82DRAFT_587180 [Fennellomyces sp. T-0311]|nr:hypothetical protein BJV82DRAFT_587180 [Fennellomyces sp. T-0311]
MAITTTTTTPTSTATSQSTFVLQVDRSCRRSYHSDDDYGPAVCECGRTLTAGWQCEYCRRNCPYCHRALTTDPQDYCDRCFRLCNIHGLYLYYNIKTGQRMDGCPSCQTKPT